MKKNEDNKVVAIVGGHFSPAYALVEGLRKQNIPVIFIGRTDSFTGISSPTLEHALIKRISGVTFYPFDSGRFNSKVSNNTIVKQLSLFIRAVIEAWKILYKTHPKKVIVFGGYLAVPVALCAFVLRIPIYLHEQTISPGKATLLIAKIARKIFVAFPQAEKYFKSAIITGNPYHSNFLSVKKPSWYTPLPNKPLILVMGGSSGAHQINVLIENNLPELSKNFQIVHQLGISEYGDYERMKTYASDNYIPIPFIAPNEHGYLFSHAELALTRVGANTFFLLVYYGLPSLLIPLPFASNDEQQKHAQILENAGVGIILHQNDAFIPTVRSLAGNAQNYRIHFTELRDYKKLVVSPQFILNEIVES
ncbi:MAG: UDP-N-acetylglucosamine--N-acetylmuramyl-(pentapeptide) pyrophosphoryl-undecaprenol N-acetylglucosamine transferase [Candidatus Roizmanbacteria bacterium]|nr:UDP-N-acetylglucosamine--N-acetylmuramyl-(pentapeptide) pyrophosphoryl-undecaprenol N-acetylglucosamine transferase [Candidatus Roizmanbacteria bacterium]